MAILLAPPFWVAVGEAAAAVGAFFTANAVPIAAGAVVVGGGAVVVNQMSKAEEEAQSREQAGTQTEACATCQNPCAELAAGVPGSKYRGGAHSATALPVGDGLDSHHTPASAASPLPRAMGPAIQMDPVDHWQTASNGRMPGHAIYIADQRTMVASGNFMGAIGLDIADIKAKFGDKYDGAIAQMMAYANCLKKNGLI